MTVEALSKIALMVAVRAIAAAPNTHAQAARLLRAAARALPTELKRDMLAMLADLLVLDDAAVSALWCPEFALGSWVTELSLRGCSRATAAGVATALHLSTQPDCSQQLPLPQQITWSCLRSLVLHNCHHTRDADLQLLLPALPGLASLDVSGCHRLGDASVAAVGTAAAAAAGNLTALDVSGCWQVTDLSPLHTCRQLRSLRVQGCWQLGDGPIGGLLHTAASLEELDAGGLVHLGDAGISGLWGGQLPAMPWRLTVGTDEGHNPHGQQGSTAAELPARPLDHNWRPCECRSSLTSLSLGGTCVSSPALPLLAACCPGLARLSITGGGSGGARDGGRKVAGWAVLLAARVRAEQLRSQKATDALGAQARGATGAKVPREGELMEAVESAGTAEGSQRVQGRPAERPLEAVPWVSLSVAGLGEWEEELEEGLEAAGWRTGWAAGIEDGDGGREAAGGRGGVGGDGYLERLARLLASGLGRQRTGQCGVLGTAGVEKGVSGERLQGGPTAGGRLQGNMAGRVRAQQERDGEWEQDFGEWEEMYEVARGRERYRDWSHELTREAAAVAERLRGGGGGMLEDLFGGPCAEVVGGLTSLDMAGVEQVTDMVAATLSGSCPRLASLSLAGCTRLSDEGLGHLAALTRLTSLDLSGCATKAAATRVRAPGSAFRRPAGSLPHAAAGGASASATGHSDHKRQRRAGVTDEGLSDLIIRLHQQGSQSPTDSRPAAASSRADPGGKGAGVWEGSGSGSAGGMVACGLRGLAVGGTDAGECTLRALGACGGGLTRLELQGCRAVSDLELLQVLDSCPSISTLKLSGCSQLSPAALGHSQMPASTTTAAAAATHSAATSRLPSHPTSHNPFPSTSASHAPPSPQPHHPASQPPPTILQRNARARSLRKVSLPGRMSNDATVAWLLGLPTDHPYTSPHLPDSLWTLQHLDLSSPSSTSSPATASSIPTAPIASTLSSTHITDSLLQRLPLSCPLLHTLRLRGAAAVTDAGAAAALAGLRLLRRFTLTGSPHVTDATLTLAVSLALAQPSASTRAAREDLHMGVLAGPTGAVQEPGEDSGGGDHFSWRGCVSTSAPLGCLLHLDLSGCGGISGVGVLPADAHAARCQGGGGVGQLGGGGAPWVDNTQGSSACGGCEAQLLSRPRAADPRPTAPSPPPQQQQELLLLSLSLEGCRQLRSAALPAILTRCLHLQSLAAPLDSVLLVQAMRSCRNLRSLKVTANDSRGRGGGAGSGRAQLGPGSGAAGGGGGADGGGVLRAWPGNAEAMRCTVASLAAGAVAGTHGEGHGELGASVRVGGGCDGCGRGIGVQDSGWLALSRLEVPSSLRTDPQLRAWLAARPWVAVSYS